MHTFIENSSTSLRKSVWRECITINVCNERA